MALLLESWLFIKKYNLYHLILSTFPLFAQAQNWQQVSDFAGVQRDDAVSFVIGDIAYCGTGNMPWGIGTVDFFGLDLTNDIWFSIASLPIGEERQYACGFSTNENGFVFGGYSAGSFYNDIWMYDPILDSWLEKTPLPSVGRSGSSCFVIGDTVYIIGGKTATDYAIDEVWAYNMVTDNWIQKNDFPFGTIWRSSATASPDKGYLIFGKDSSLNYSDVLFEYDFSSDTWIEIAQFPLTGRIYSSLNFFNNQLLVIGGLDSLSNSYNDFWKFDLTDGSWTQLNSIPSNGRRGGVSFVSNSSIYYTTGIDASNQRLKETWKNDNPLIVFGEEGQEISIYPIPTSEILTVKIPDTKKEIGITIFNINGEVVFEDSAILNQSEIKLDVTSFKVGIYFIVVKNQDQIYSATFVKN